MLIYLLLLDFIQTVSTCTWGLHAAKLGCYLITLSSSTPFATFDAISLA